MDMKWKLASAKYRRAIPKPWLPPCPRWSSRRRASRPIPISAVRSWAGDTTPGFARQYPLTWRPYSSGYRAIPGQCQTWAAQPMPAPCWTRPSSGLGDGTRAAATSARRQPRRPVQRAGWAVKLGLLDANPLKDLRWTTPRASHAIDPRRVINPGQARALLAAVDAQQPSGPRLVAFFGVMYYCGLRPEEAVMLRTADLRLPADDRWGEIHVTTTAPDTSTGGRTPEPSETGAA